VRALAALPAVALPIAACSTAPSAEAVDLCAAVEQRYAAHRAEIPEKLRELEAQELADRARGKGELERNMKFRGFMALLEQEEMRYRVGMRKCGGTTTPVSTSNIMEAR
jgi:hypothetical protein